MVGLRRSDILLASLRDVSLLRFGGDLGLCPSSLSWVPTQVLPNVDPFSLLPMDIRHPAMLRLN